MHCASIKFAAINLLNAVHIIYMLCFTTLCIFLRFIACTASYSVVPSLLH